MNPRRAGAIIAIVLTAMLVAAWVTPKVRRRMDLQGLRPVTVARGLDTPWGMAFLPDGTMLVTERPGRMRMIDSHGLVPEPLAGLPPVSAKGEGGLMDVVLDPQFAQNQTLYWTYSEPGLGGGPGSSTAVARGRLVGRALQEVAVIFRQEDKLEAEEHFGSRLLFADGRLFVSLGDRSRRNDAQSLASTHGKILRIETDGAAPADNPFANQPDAVPHIWSFGHRNVQGLALQPGTGALWASEHGVQGGDEVNIIERGRNYGWPMITSSCEYESCAPIGEGDRKDGIEAPVRQWSPVSIAPAGMVFLTSDRYPDWKGDLFIGMLQGRALLRLKLDGRQVVEEQRLLTGLLDRIRDVRQGPDGWLYVLTGRQDGRVLRVER